MSGVTLRHLLFISKGFKYHRVWPPRSNEVEAAWRGESSGNPVSGSLDGVIALSSAVSVRDCVG